MEAEGIKADIQKAEQTLQDKNNERYMRAALDMVWQLIRPSQASGNYSMYVGRTGLGLK